MIITDFSRLDNMIIYDPTNQSFFTDSNLLGYHYLGSPFYLAHFTKQLSYAKLMQKVVAECTLKEILNHEYQFKIGNQFIELDVKRLAIVRCELNYQVDVKAHP
jgi:hypothetical protein